MKMIKSFILFGLIFIFNLSRNTFAMEFFDCNKPFNPYLLTELTRAPFYLGMPNKEVRKIWFKTLRASERQRAADKHLEPDTGYMFAYPLGKYSELISLYVRRGVLDEITHPLRSKGHILTFINRATIECLDSIKKIKIVFLPSEKLSGWPNPNSERYQRYQKFRSEGITMDQMNIYLTIEDYEYLAWRWHEAILELAHIWNNYGYAEVTLKTKKKNDNR